ncbi:MAG: PIG-L family deacetylase [Verrucomicrobiaceae bacterium]|nr:PIG-L family deacetylase [Verrucomicrobiaceae bacterium]
MRKSAIAVFAHPDDIEFVAAGTLLLLAEAGWEIHYMNLSRGNCGSVQFDPETTARLRLEEGKNAAHILGAHFHGPIANDLEINYCPELIKKVAAAIRQAKASIVLTHSPQDYMEDHMSTSRLAVTAAFTHGMPNFESDPPVEVYGGDVVVYHALPHGLRDPLRRRVRAGLYVDTSSVHQRKRLALAAHESQKHWLDVSQGMDSYLVSMDESAAEVGKLSGKYQQAEGWRRHLHLGFSANEIDPLADALAGKCWVDPAYESSLEG